MASSDTSPLAGGDPSTVKLDDRSIVGTCGISSLVVLIASTSICTRVQGSCHDDVAWGVACSTLSLAVCLIYCLAVHFKIGVVGSAKAPMACFLFLLWIPGVLVLTAPRAPFNVAGNGFFGCWSALLSAGLFLHRTVDRFKAVVDNVRGSQWRKKLLIALGVVSTAELVEASIDCGSRNASCTDEVAYAVAVGAVSVPTVLLIMFLGEKMGDKVCKLIAVMLCLWWLVAACICTFRGPFIIVDNGWVSCWAGAVISLALVMDAFKVTPS